MWYFFDRWFPSRFAWARAAILSTKYKANIRYSYRYSTGTATKSQRNCKKRCHNRGVFCLLCSLELSHWYRGDFGLCHTVSITSTCRKFIHPSHVIKSYVMNSCSSCLHVVRAGNNSPHGFADRSTQLNASSLLPVAVWGCSERWYGRGLWVGVFYVR